MTLENRIENSEQRYKQLQTQRDEYLKAAEDNLTEMTKLQGEWRVLQDLKKEMEEAANTQPTVIEAIPEPVKKTKKGK